MAAARTRKASSKVPLHGKITAVNSGSRAVVNGRTVISVPVKISGFKAPKAKPS